VGPLLCPEQTVVVESDPSKARAIARRFLSVYLSQPNYVNNILEIGFDHDDLSDGGSDRLVDELVVWGDVERVLGRVDEHLQAGADHVALQVLSETPGQVPMRAWRELATALPDVGR